MSTLTTSFNIIVRSYDQKWADQIADIRSGGGELGKAFPLKLTDGTQTSIKIVDIDETTGDITFGLNEKFTKMAMKNVSKVGELPVGWSNSDVREYCNNTFLNLLPTSIKNNIKSKKQKYALVTKYSAQSDYYEIEEIQDDVWVPSIEEIFASYEITSYISKYVYIDESTHKKLALYTSSTADKDNKLNRANFVTYKGNKESGSWLTSTYIGNSASSNVGFQSLGVGSVGSSYGGIYTTAITRCNAISGVTPHFTIAA